MFFKGAEGFPRGNLATRVDPCRPINKDKDGCPPPGTLVSWLTESNCFVQFWGRLWEGPLKVEKIHTDNSPIGFCCKESKKGQQWHWVIPVFEMTHHTEDALAVIACQRLPSCHLTFNTMSTGLSAYRLRMHHACPWLSGPVMVGG